MPLVPPLRTQSEGYDDAERRTLREQVRTLAYENTRLRVWLSTHHPHVLTSYNTMREAESADA